MKQMYSWDYLWRHPEKYIRMDKDDLKNNEAVLNLCESILAGTREDCDSVVKALHFSPNSQDARQNAIDLNRCLTNDPIAAMSFGGSIELARQFRKRCPGGLFNE